VIDHKRLSELFLAACRLPPGERPAFLDRVCGEDAALRLELEAMLARDEDDDASLMLAAPIIEASAAPTDPRIGPYRLIQKIGEGGMGEVWLTEQVEPVRRKVALKIIKAGMDTRQVVARFEAERQALALMNHPAIAKVLDAGTTPRGLPFFVMEYIDGVPITEHADRHRLTTWERIELLVQVCEGVQHAHQKAIIHRDLKPSNVLVTMHDGRALPKIIDFGVAKAISQRLTEKTLFTELGALIGTPEYMSPEQAQLAGDDIDTRTDIYALGVMLYELLVGALPFDSKELRRAGFAEIVRRICEDEPLRPSIRVGTLGDASTESAARRRVDSRALRRQLRGDLDWITMKALEKDRSRRYGSPAEMAADLARHLRDEPVLAGAPGVRYRARKFVRRHKLAVASASVVLVALALGIVGTTVGMIRARRAEADVRRQAAISERIAGFMSNALGNVDSNRMGGVMIADLRKRAAQRGLGADLDRGLSMLSGTDTARLLLGDEILGRAATNADTEGKDDPLVAAGLQHTIGRTFRKLGFPEAAERHAERALATRERLLGPNDRETLRTSQLMCGIRYQQGRFHEAEAIARKTLEARRGAFGPEDPETLSSMNDLAMELHRIGKFEEAEKLFLESLALHRRVLGPEAPQTLSLVNDLGFMYQVQERFQDAEPLQRSNLETRSRVLPPNDRDTLWSMFNLAWCCMETGKVDEAAALVERCLKAREEILGDDHPDTVIAMSLRARVTRARGDYRKAREQFRQTVAGWDRLSLKSHTERFQARTGEAHCSYVLGDLEDARRALETILPAYQKGELADNDSFRFAFRVLYTVYQAGGWTDPARRLERDLLPVWRRIIAKGAEDSYTSHLGIALALLDEGHGSRAAAEEALREARRSAELMPKARDRFTRLCSALAAQAMAHHLLGQSAEAIAQQREAISHIPENERLLRARFEATLARYERDASTHTRKK
jgi:non-specific serine/threonine protein kinase/serine/threonine-protein kinase